MLDTHCVKENAPTFKETTENIPKIVAEPKTKKMEPGKRPMSMGYAYTTCCVCIEN